MFGGLILKAGTVVVLAVGQNCVRPNVNGYFALYGMVNASVCVADGDGDAEGGFFFGRPIL